MSLNKQLKSLEKQKLTRKKKIKSLISERNDREYYLSLNTNQFKTKINNLKKMHSGIKTDLKKRIKGNICHNSSKFL